MLFLWFDSVVYHSAKSAKFVQWIWKFSGTESVHLPSQGVMGVDPVLSCQFDATRQSPLELREIRDGNKF